MSSYRDKTFCASPNCTNECGRKMTAEEAYRLKELQSFRCNLPVSYAYFCGEPNRFSGENENHVSTK